MDNNSIGPRPCTRSRGRPGRPGSAKRQVGFTILEIVIVFILLAGIMAFVGPKIFEQMGKSSSCATERWCASSHDRAGPSCRKPSAS